MDRRSYQALRVSDLFIRIMCDLLDAHGFDPGAALQAAGLPRALPTRDGTVSGPALLAFRRAFVRQTDDRRELWSLLAGRYTLELTQSYGLASRTAPDLTAIVKLLADGDLHTSFVSIRGIRDEVNQLVGIEIDPSDAPEDIRSFESVLATVSLIRSWDSVWAGQVPYQHMELPYDVSLEAIGRRDHGRIVRSEDTARLLWTPDVGVHTLPGANAYLHNQYAQQLRRRVMELRRSTALHHRVSKRMHEPDGVAASVTDLAAEFNVSARTLQRALALQGVSFRTLQEKGKRALAAQALSETTSPIGVIAQELGYATPSSFSYAFRTWFHQSPSQYRAAHSQGAQND